MCPDPVHTWLTASHWEDAIPPLATWAGLWSTHHHTYRYPRPSSLYNVTANCRLLLHRLHPTANDQRPL